MAPRGPRVIGGSARGLELRAPTGGGTRPTTGRLREALFGVLESAGTSFASVLDLYAGSGALGIEALSRGDGVATFVESDRRAVLLIRENLTRARLSERATVVSARVGRWRPPVGARYSLVLADPPYDLSLSSGQDVARASYHGAADAGARRTETGLTLANTWRDIDVTVGGHLASDAFVVVEHNARLPAPPSLAGLVLWRDRRHGAGAVAIYREAVSGVHDADDESGEAAELEGDNG